MMRKVQTKIYPFDEDNNSVPFDEEKTRADDEERLADSENNSRDDDAPVRSSRTETDAVAHTPRQLRQHPPEFQTFECIRALSRLETVKISAQNEPATPRSKSVSWVPLGSAGMRFDYSSYWDNPLMMPHKIAALESSNSPNQKKQIMMENVDTASTWSTSSPLIGGSFLPSTPPPTTSFRLGSLLTSPPLPLRLCFDQDGVFHSCGQPEAIQCGDGSAADDHNQRGQAHKRGSPEKSRVETIGRKHLRIYKTRLPQHLIDLMDLVVERAETYAANKPHGWQAGLYSLTKQDLPVNSITGAKSICQPITDFVCKIISDLYGANTVLMDQNQPHILKYNAVDGLRGVPLHQDRCAVTANIMLSDRKSYEGGGTVFAAINEVVHLEKGELIMHPGNLVHGGCNVEHGARYLLVFFCATGDGEI